MDLYTKNGEPLQVVGKIVYSKSGIVVGQINNGKVFDSNGNYVGTIFNDRLVYRSTDSILISSVFIASNIIGTAKANRIGSAILGEEPKIPE